MKKCKYENCNGKYFCCGVCRNHYNFENRKHINEVKQVWSDKNREHVRQYDRNKYKNNPWNKWSEQRKMNIRNTNKRKHHKLKDIVFGYLGISLCNCIDPTCWCKGKCTMTDPRILQLDHTKDDGKEDRKRFGKNPTRLYRYYSKHKEEAQEKLQIMCIGCNWCKMLKCFGWTV